MSHVSHVELEHLGWDSSFAKAFESLGIPDVIPARIGIEHNHLYRVITGERELLAETTGNLRHMASGSDALPAVGDWVAVRISDDFQAKICAILPRRSCFSRKSSSNPTKRQIVAANVDTVFLVSGLDRNFSPRRVERYLVAAAESGAEPVIVLNKTDLCDAVGDAVKAIQVITESVPIHTTSSSEPDGLNQLEVYLRHGRTVAFLGSSGVGKSTIINFLLGSNRQKTQSVRQRDQRGRHTTVHRELLVRSKGGVIIDTPGMRELQLWDSDRALESAFDDIDVFSQACRFRDCHHQTEPGCAVRQAVSGGQLTADRLSHYHQLQNERATLDERRKQLAQMIEQRKSKLSRPPNRVTRRLSRE